jgi:O-antigen/teichoic acid export membrane protein
MTSSENVRQHDKRTTDSLKTDTLAASVAILLILTVVQRGVGFLRGVFFCRWLDADQLGQWDMAFGFLMLAAPLAVLGLPGSFGRYVEHYRQRGQLKTFLRRTMVCTAVLTVLAVAAVGFGKEWFSQLVFGSSEHADLVMILAAGLGVVIIGNALQSLLTALRQVKVVSIIQFCNSLLFAVAGIGLLLFWRISTTSIVVAFAGACLLTATASLVWLARIWGTLPSAGVALGHSTLWGKLMPFAFWLWLTNWLSNLFGITDRLMIIHCGGVPSDIALGLVGQYHTARMFPMLFVGVAELLGAVITPHLSSDWESGRRSWVSRRLRLMLKAFGLGFTAAAIVVLIGSPILFDFAWQGRYDGGLAVLPWALACSIWTGLAFISYNYLWCAEKSRFVSLTLFVGLAANIGLNLILLPKFGLLGAVLATAAARLVSLGILWVITRNLGMKIDRGLLIVAGLPLLLVLGPWVALIGLIAVVVGNVPGIGCFVAAEKTEIAAAVRQYWLKCRQRFGRGRLASE